MYLTYLRCCIIHSDTVDDEVVLNRIHELSKYSWLYEHLLYTPVTSPLAITEALFGKRCSVRSQQRKSRHTSLSSELQ